MPRTQPVPPYGDYYKNYTIFPQRVADLKWYGSNLTARVNNMASQFFGLSQVVNNYKPTYPGLSACQCLCRQIIFRESTWNPNKTNTYTSGGTTYTVYGLWQISNIHSAMNWWPTRQGLPLSTMFNSEYNTRCAFTMMNSEFNAGRNPFASPWAATYGGAKTDCGVG